MPISHNSEELSFEKYSSQYDHKICSDKKMISPINEAIDEERSATPDSSILMRKNEHYYSQPNNVKASQSKNTKTNTNMAPYKSS